MSDNRDAQALDYDPNYNKTKYVKDYKDIKAKGKREGHPDIQPHHIRGLNNYHYAWKHLHPDNRSKLQAELRPYGLQFGNDKDNLLASEGQWSKSTPGETRYGGQHGQLHSEQESAMQNELSVDRFKGSYRGVSGVTWSEMSQEQIMDFLRSMAVKDEMVANRTLSTALPLSSAHQVLDVRRKSNFANRLIQGDLRPVDVADAVTNVPGVAQAKSLVQATNPDLNIEDDFNRSVEEVSSIGKDLFSKARNEFQYMGNRLMQGKLPYAP